MRPAAVAVVLALLFGPSMHGQTPEIRVDPSTGEFIIKTVLEKTAENEPLKKATLTYQRIYDVYNLNEQEQVTNRAKEEVVLIEPGGRERLVEKDGKPVRDGSISGQKFNLLAVFKALTKLHNFSIVRIELVEGRPSYVISFKPKPNQKSSGDVENVIVRSEGVMYVDIEKFYIQRLSARMLRPYSPWRALGGFNLSRADIEMVQEEFDGIVVMKSVTITDRYWSVTRGTVFEKQTYTYQDYKQVQPR